MNLLPEGGNFAPQTENFWARQGFQCEKWVLGGRNHKTKKRPKRTSFSRGSQCTIRAHSQRPGRCRAQRLKFGVHFWEEHATSKSTQWGPAERDRIDPPFYACTLTWEFERRRRRGVMTASAGFDVRASKPGDLTCVRVVR